MRRAKSAPESPLWEHFLHGESRSETLAPTLEDRGTHLVVTFPLPTWASKRDIDVTVYDGLLYVTADARRSTRGRSQDLRAHGTLHIGPIPAEDILVEIEGEELRVLIPSLGPDPVHVPIVDRDTGVLLHA